jgi:MFS family permease
MHTKRKNFQRNALLNPFSKLGFLHILNDGFLASFSLLLPFIQKDLNIGFGKIGMVTSILNMAGIVLAVPSASISMRFGGYKVIIISMLFYCSAFFITGLSANYLTLVSAFVVASIGFGMFHPISFALVANTSDVKNIGRNMGAFTAVGDIGRIGIAAFVTLLVSLVNWRNTAFIYGSVPLSLFLMSLLFCKKLDFASDFKKEKTVKMHGLHKCAAYLIVLLTSFIDGLASSSLFVFLPFLYVSKGASAALLGSLTGAFFVGNMLGKIIIGKITDVYGCKKVFICSEIIMAILLIFLSAISNIAVLVAISILLGAVTKGTVPVINSLLAKSVPDQRLNQKAFGIVSLVGGIASVIAPILYGFVAQRVGINAVFLFSACIALVAIVPIVLNALFGRKKGTMIN